jgi:DNA mismatch repair protein MLH3
LNGVVVELVKNALDAKAHTINVTIDFRRGGCKVDDDGDGILPSDFEPSGGLGKAHRTSNIRQVNSSLLISWQIHQNSALLATCMVGKAYF